MEPWRIWSPGGSEDQWSQILIQIRIKGKGGSDPDPHPVNSWIEIRVKGIVSRDEGLKNQISTLSIRADR
jgi:hypothetical protein